MARKSPRDQRKAGSALPVPVLEPPPAPLGKRPPGRPPIYSAETYAEVLERLATGEFFTELEKDLRYPAARTVREKVRHDPVFAVAYARAREMQSHAHAERSVMAAREATAENWQQKRLLFDAERWIAAKLDPANYGDKVDLNHRGSVAVTAVPYDPSVLTAEQREVMRDVLLITPTTIEGKAE